MTEPACQALPTSIPVRRGRLAFDEAGPLRRAVPAWHYGIQGRLLADHLCTAVHLVKLQGRRHASGKAEHMLMAGGNQPGVMPCPLCTASSRRQCRKRRRRAKLGKPPRQAHPDPRLRQGVRQGAQPAAQHHHLPASGVANEGLQVAVVGPALIPDREEFEAGTAGSPPGTQVLPLVSEGLQRTSCLSGAHPMCSSPAA